MLVVFAVLVTVKTEAQGSREILNCWIRIACGKRGEIETALNQLQYRYGFIFSIVDAAFPGEWGNDYPRDTHANTPFVFSLRRNHVIPTPAIFVVGDNDYEIFPNFALLHRSNEVSHVLLPRYYVCVSWMLIVFTDRLDERHRRQIAGSDVREEILLILQMRIWPCRGRLELRRFQCGIIRRRSRQERSIFRVIGERLVMEL